MQLTTPQPMTIRLQEAIQRVLIHTLSSFGSLC